MALFPRSRSPRPVGHAAGRPARPAGRSLVAALVVVVAVAACGVRGSWSDLAPPRLPFLDEGQGGGGFDTIACASSGFCLGAGSVQVDDMVSAGGQAWDGVSWQPVTAPRGLPTLDSLSCPATRWCAATAGDGLVIWDGTRWTTTSALRLWADGSPASRSDVSCGTPASCVAVSGRHAAAWNGTSWRDVSPAAAAGEALSIVSCAGPSFCLAAADAGGQAERWDGTTWRPVPIPRPLDGLRVRDLACPAVDRCLAAVADLGIPVPPSSTPTEHAALVRWDGTAWTRETAPGLRVTRLACARADRCLGVDGSDGVVLLDGAWKPAPALPLPAEAAVRLDAVSCGPDWCVVAGNRRAPGEVPVALRYRF